MFLGALWGVSGGYAANLLIGSLDTLLSGITQSAVDLIDPSYKVNVMGNYIFLVVSTFLITFIGTIVTEKIIEPRLGTFSGEFSQEEDSSLTTITPLEKKGLRNAGISAFIFVIVVLFLPISNSTFLDSIVILISFLFLLPGIAYGRTVGTFSSQNSVCDAMTKSMSSMGSFLVLAFVSAQFINYFNYTKLGTIVALTGANFFKTVNIGLIPLMIIFILFSAFMNLFMGSASAKWNILAPVFVPMFMLLGHSQELCQLAYRIGDSCTNIITPMMTYFSVILALKQSMQATAHGILMFLIITIISCMKQEKRSGISWMKHAKSF